MTEQFIKCPNCGQKIQLTEAFTHEIEEKVRKKFESEAKKKDEEYERRLETQKKESEQKLREERGKLEAQAKKRAEESIATELKDLKDQLHEKTKQVEEAQKQELALRKRQRELEERERNIKLEATRTVDNERKKIWEQAAAQTAEEHRFKDLEKDKQNADLRKQLEEMKRKLEQGSQQTQGDVQEIELEDLLCRNFRFDDIQPVPKGVRGADVLQKVQTPSAQPCGTILWESKRTKSWDYKWIQKLKDDQREAKAVIAVIVSEVLPKDVNRIGQVDEIWVTDFRSAVGLAMALRAGLVEVANARIASVGQSEKMEQMYNYLSGPEFRQRVEAIIESFKAMKEDLDAEKRAMQKIWAKREKQIERVIKNTSGMYGALEGIIGASLPSIKILELPSPTVEEVEPDAESEKDLETEKAEIWETLAKERERRNKQVPKR
jgi:hypothetical protein